MRRGFIEPQTYRHAIDAMRPDNGDHDSQSGRWMTEPDRASVAGIFARMDVAEPGFCRFVNRSTELTLVRTFFRIVSRLGDGVVWYGLMALLPFAYGEAGARVTFRWRSRRSPASASIAISRDVSCARARTLPTSACVRRRRRCHRLRAGEHQLAVATHAVSETQRLAAGS
jgi:hypothetical protein